MVRNRNIFFSAVFLLLFIGTVSAEFWDVAPEFVKAGDSFDVLKFNITNTTETGILRRITINFTGDLIEDDLINITLTSSSGNVVTNSNFPYFPNATFGGFIALNWDIEEEQNLTIKINLDESAGEITFSINVIEINGGNITHSPLPFGIKNIIIDNTAPQVEIISPVAFADVSGEIVLSAMIIDASGVDSVAFNISNSSEQLEILEATKNDNLYNAIFDTTTLSDGEYNLSVIANDTLGQINDSVSITFTIDNTMPEISLSHSSSARDSITVSFNCADELSGIKSCVLLSSSGDVSGNVVSGLNCGSDYDISVSAEDNAGNIFSVSQTMRTSNCGSSSSGGGYGGGGRIPIEYNVSESDLEGGYSELLLVTDKLRFDGHVLTLNFFNSTTARVTIQSEPVVLNLTKNEIVIFDLNRDGENDISLRYDGIENGRARIFIQKFSQREKETLPDDEIIFDENRKISKDKSSLWGIILLVILIVIVTVALSKNIKKSKVRTNLFSFININNILF